MRRQRERDERAFKFERTAQVPLISVMTPLLFSFKSYAAFLYCELKSEMISMNNPAYSGWSDTSEMNKINVE